MNKDKSSLGTGLDSLLGERPKTDPQGVNEIAIEDLSPGQYQPRKKMYKRNSMHVSIKKADSVITNKATESAKPLSFPTQNNALKATVSIGSTRRFWEVASRPQIGTVGIGRNQTIA